MLALHPIKTVVLLDPVCRLVEHLSHLHGSGESVSGLLHDKEIILDNTALTRSGPPGVMACAGRWKLTK